MGAVASEGAIGASEAIVVQGLDYRDGELLMSGIDSGANDREPVVDVAYIDLVVFKKFEDICSSGRWQTVPDRRKPRPINQC